MQVKKQQLELDMEQWTGCKLGKEYVKAAYCFSAYLTYIQNTSGEMLVWVKQKLESREQHRNMYTIKGETDHQPRLDA